MKVLSRVIFCCCLLFLSFNSISAFLRHWTFDLVDSTTYTSDPDIVDWEYKIERIGRGIFGYSGFVDFKVDLYDNVLVSGTLKRSKYKDGPYLRMPFSIDNETLSNAMNKFYKRMAMPSVEKCCENAPVFKNKFVAPLTKRNVTMNKCVFSTDGLPSVMMDGYYLARVTLADDRDFETYLEVLVYIENN